MNDEDIIIFNNSDFEINRQLDSLQEITRNKYKPKNIRYLLVGESMPSGGTFFYCENSDLYRYTKEVFLKNFNWKEEKFLEYFMRNGFYFDDLCQEPVDNLGDTKRRNARKAYESDLADRIKKYKPLIIVSLLLSVERNVNHAILKAGLDIPHIAITSPFRGRHLVYM